jgi:hypothetical protein
VSQSDYLRKHELECTRFASECMQWWATLLALLCSGISLEWRGYGPPMRNTAQGQIWLPTLKREFECRRDVRRDFFLKD